MLFSDNGGSRLRGSSLPFELRAYQNNIIKRTRAHMSNGDRAILVVAPTGAGKTLLSAYMLGAASKKGLRSWFLNHRRELIKQSSDTFGEMDIDHGIISPDFPIELYKPVQIASIQTVARRIQNLHPPKLIIWDEAHHLSARSWDKIFKEMPDSFHVGLTATPIRLDGKGLKDWFPKMVQGPTVPELIEQGYLSPYKIYAPSKIDTSRLHTKMGDFVKSELEAVVDKPTITGNAIHHYIKYMDGKRAVVFCASIRHSQHVVADFNANKIPAAHVDGETPTAERDGAIKRFRKGELKILSNVDLFGEGFDIPSMEGAILLRPTQSLGLFLQQCGRALRPYPGKKEAIILDHAGNCLTHGLPDEIREWTLEDRERRGRGQSDGSGVRLCPKCFAAQLPGPPICKYCGFVFEVKPRKVDEVEGDLAEMKAGMIKKKARVEQGMTNSFHDLIALGKQRGYKNPYGWARFVFNARQAKKLGRA